jgi:hypothetical protein
MISTTDEGKSTTDEGKPDTEMVENIKRREREGGEKG